MSVMLQIKGISKNYGARVLLEDATASFSKYQKIGVIGRNGTGKSTLCKIITGQEEADSGTISRNNELRLSYLEQHDPYKETETVLGFLTRYTGKEDWECAEIAGRFQIKNERLDAPISALAGGYRTRVKLAAMLLRDPNFLVLDEPTNYLDLSTLIILENFLQDFNGGFLIVSHDREFLKRTCDHTLEVENGQVMMYPGDVEEYFEFKEEQLQQKMAHNVAVEKKRAQLQEFVDRFKARASTATRAKSKMKQIDKLKTIEIAHPMSSVTIKIPSIERKGGIAVFVDDLSIGYPDKVVATGISMEVERGSRVAVLGDNGQGKTTFLRTLAGDLQPKAGSFRWGTGLKIGYYAQHVFQTLHPEDDVFTHLTRSAERGVTQQDVLNIAGSFLFRGDDVKKKIKVLSGGERARLVLAGLLLAKCHVLLLDEPTNHLDFETVEALAGALRQFEGTVFFICHDRTFVNLIATTILDVKEGRVLRYPGSYEDYVYFLERQAKDELFSDGSQPYEPKPKHSKKDPVEEARRETTRLKVEIGECEAKIQGLKTERDAITQEFIAKPTAYSRERKERLDTVTQELAGEEERWLRLQEELEKLK